MKLNMIRLLILAFAGAFIAGCGEATDVENAPAADTAQEVVEEVKDAAAETVEEEKKDSQ